MGVAGIQAQQADTTQAAKPEPISLIEISYEIEQAEKSFNKMKASTSPDPRYEAIDSMFTLYKSFLEKEAKDFMSYNPYNLSNFFLENSYRLWEGFTQILNGWRSEINGLLKKVQGEIEQLNGIQEVWDLTLNSGELDDDTRVMKDRIQAMLRESNVLKDRLGRLKWKYIELEDKLTEMVTYCDNIISEIEQLQQNQRDSLFMAVSPPLWKVHADSLDYSNIGGKLGKFKYENGKILKNYFRTQSLRSFWTVILMILLFILWMRHLYKRIGYDDSEPGHKLITRIMDRNLLATLVALALATFHLMHPYYPVVLNHIITLAILVITRYVLSRFIDPEDKRFILLLIILLLINDLEVVFWYFGELSRYYLLMESLAGIVLVMPLLFTFPWKNFKEQHFIKRAKIFLVFVIIAFYLTGLVANLFGYLDLAVLMLKVGIHVPEITVVLYGMYKITVALIRMMISVWSHGKSEFFSEYWANIESRAVKIAGILAVVYWFYTLLVSFEVSRIFISSVAEFLKAERNVGVMQITIGSLLALVLIILVTFLLTGIIKILLEHVLLKKTRLPRGVPAAISVSIRYFLIILGFLFALSAAGIDLGKFSLLAGALGVGIGFGLQNIVNNFISGLIIVYERPIQVGDTIEVESLLGQVRRIGLRSSNVKTYDGAEVVVPNSNLISNQLINWTLSDNKRRNEIKVGVSYGSDPNIVLELLEKAASSHEDVIMDPAPWALFENFGDSSLNFRLLFWTPYEVGMRTKSAVAVNIFNIFKENGIEIPFPQLDLHVKEKGDELSEEEIRDMESPKN